MYIIPTVPHLRNAKLTMAYRELPERESQLLSWTPLQKWKNDPDAHRFMGFAPRNRYFVNGSLVHEERPRLSPISKTPFPENRVPRRGLLAVSPGDPDYAHLCKEQGLEHLLDAPSPLLPNGIHSSPTSPGSTIRPNREINGIASPSRTMNRSLNSSGHHSISPSSEAGAPQSRALVNGINGTAHGDAE